MIDYPSAPRLICSYHRCCAVAARFLRASIGQRRSPEPKTRAWQTLISSQCYKNPLILVAALTSFSSWLPKSWTTFPLQLERSKSLLILHNRQFKSSFSHDCITLSSATEISPLYWFSWLSLKNDYPFNQVQFLCFDFLVSWTIITVYITVYMSLKLELFMCKIDMWKCWKFERLILCVKKENGGFGVECKFDDWIIGVTMEAQGIMLL